MSDLADDADYEQMVRAYEMVTRKENRLSIRAAAEELGRSKSTVQRWVRKVTQAEEYMDLLDVAEVRVAQAFRVDEYIRMLRHRVEAEGRPIEQISPHLLGFEKFVSDLLGTKAPARLQFEQTGSGVGMDPRIVAAIRDAKRLVADERNGQADG